MLNFNRFHDLVDNLPLDAFIGGEVDVLLHEVLHLLLGDLTVVLIQRLGHVHELLTVLDLILEVLELAPDTIGRELMDQMHSIRGRS